MVRLSARKSLLTIVVIVLFISFFSVYFVHGLRIEYHVEKQWVKIWINKDGTIDLLYNLTLACDSGGVITWITIGQPNKEFTIGSCTDLYGQRLQARKIVDGWWGVNCTLKDPLKPGQKGTVILLTRVDKMIWEDETNPGNVCMMFTASWWDVSVEDLRIAVVLPQSVKKEEIRCSPDWNNCSLEEEKWVVYWEQSSLSPNKRFPVGVSFPKKYVDKWSSRSIWDQVVGALGSITLPLAALSVIAIAAVVIMKSRGRLAYTQPRFSMEALGVQKGLTAVEAATLLDVEPRKVLTMILFGLMKKGAVKVLETDPRLRLRVVSTTDLHYYENWFIDAIVTSSLIGTLSDEKLSLLILKLRREVDEKVKYYCRVDTIEHYRKIVEKAWRQVNAAKTPEVKADAFNENLEWLMVAEGFRRRTKRMFSREEEVPSQSSWWLPYWVVHHSPPSFRAGAEGRPVTPPTLQGSQFANAIVTTVESTVNGIVSNIEAFSKSLAPVAPSTRAETPSPPVVRSGCVCACASCACACACASCACACASGGAG